MMIMGRKGSPDQHEQTALTTNQGEGNAKDGRSQLSSSSQLYETRLYRNIMAPAAASAETAVPTVMALNLIRGK